LGPGERPLSGIRVLDLTRVLAGPTCGRTLAEHGADVLRIGSPELPSVPGFVLDTSHGKLSAYLDLERRDDLERLRTLVGEADVFAQGYRSGSLDRRGLSPRVIWMEYDWS
jgi:crotonobetainyl-CoA:carnitine CoA-transferase CaiB-like acyl-CoA transferase